jgi:hypothetical protein
LKSFIDFAMATLPPLKASANLLIEFLAIFLIAPAPASNSGLYEVVLFKNQVPILLAVALYYITPYNAPADNKEAQPAVLLS